MSKATILFDDGKIFYAEANFNDVTVMGELVFNTSMTGYQEVLTDPSYASQIVVMTYPLVGNYGIKENFAESSKIQVSAFIIKENSETDINGLKCLSDFLAENEVLCLSGVDTREITKYIRANGSKTCLITTEKISSKHKKMLENYVLPKDVVKKVSCKEVKKYKSETKKIANIAVIDYGIKNSLIRTFCCFGADVTLYPHDTDAATILKENFDAIVLSNGPGNPKDVDITNIKNLIGKIPILGICLGHQILSLAIGANTYKLKFGHRGANHPVLNMKNGKVIITSQNHSYAVDEKTLPKNAEVIYKNINDNTVEGFSQKSTLIEGIQFHPEAGPGPDDAKNIIFDWIKSVQKEFTNA